MLRENSVRYFLLMRLIAIYISLHSSVTKKYDFLLLSDPNGWLSVIYFFYSYEVFIPFQLETTINCLKQGDLGYSFAFSQNEAKV